MNLNEEIHRYKKLMNIDENPDTVEASGNSFWDTLSHADKDTVTFGYLDGFMYVSMLTNQTSHRSVHYNIPLFYYSLTNSPNYPFKKKKYDNIFKYIVNGEDTTLNRSNFKYPGRIWTESKTISLWDLPPSLSELNKIISDVKKEINFIGTLIALPASIQNVTVSYVDIPVVYGAERNTYQRYSNWETTPYKNSLISVGEYDKYVVV